MTRKCKPMSHNANFPVQPVFQFSPSAQWYSATNFLILCSPHTTNCSCSAHKGHSTDPATVEDGEFTAQVLHNIIHASPTLLLSLRCKTKMLSPVLSIPARPARPIICLYWLRDKNWSATYGDRKMTLTKDEGEGSLSKTIVKGVKHQNGRLPPSREVDPSRKSGSACQEAQCSLTVGILNGSSFIRSEATVMVSNPKWNSLAKHSAQLSTAVLQQLVNQRLPLLYFHI